MATKFPDITLVVKGNATGDAGQECPFCRRTLATLEYKGIPYKLKFANLANKPQWLLDLNPKGTVPVMLWKEDGKETIVPDSDVIVNLLEEKFPSTPSLKCSSPEADSLLKSNTVFKTAREFAKAKATHAADVADKEAAFLKDLSALESFLSSSKGPYFGGERMCAADMGLGPKLIHVMTATPALVEGWKLPADFPALAKYHKLISNEQIMKKTNFGDDTVIAGWRAMLQGSH